ncbi:hypothetical protein GCM10027344_04240 [Spelaeicoccus albus]
MDGNQVDTLNANATPARPARPVRRTGAPRSGTPTSKADARALSEERAAARAAAKAKRVRIRRLGVGFVGLAAITVVSAVLALFSVVTWGIPLAALVLAVVDLFVLRAVHAGKPEQESSKQKAKPTAAAERTADAKPQAKPAAGPEAKGEDAVRAVRGRGQVRRVASSREADQHGSDQADSDQRAKTRSSVSMAANAFPEAGTFAASGRTAARATSTEDEPTQELHISESSVVRKRPAQAAKTATSSVSWSPVPVPRPKYLDAPKVERAEPRPLVVDASVHDKVEQPAEDTAASLSESEAKESAARQWVEEPGRRPEVEDAQPLTVNKTAAQVGRLDDVLQRRRAAGE